MKDDYDMMDGKQDTTVAMTDGKQDSSIIKEENYPQTGSSKMSSCTPLQKHPDSYNASSN